MEMAKLGNKSSYKKKIKIGILGGSFDPAHKGHVAISKEAKKKFKLKNIIWAVTKKNPLKKKSNSSIFKRIKFAKKIIKPNTFIKIKFYENIINSNKTINLINHIKKNKQLDIYFIIGADNLITFHKWNKWKLIAQKCNLIVFDRLGYKKKSFKSVAFKHLKQKNLKFVTFKKVNISSSKLRKI
jgi:nicotinate-nucleotide adenylyltransferase